MATKIFVNLPVKDLKKSMAFFTKLGYQFNMEFTNDDAACMVVSDDIFVMLLIEPFFKTFTKKQLVDATKSTEVLIALSTDEKSGVDEMLDKALNAGGKEAREPQDLGFMYSRSFEDLDGHIWEMAWMNAGSADQGN